MFDWVKSDDNMLLLSCMSHKNRYEILFIYFFGQSFW